MTTQTLSFNFNSHPLFKPKHAIQYFARRLSLLCLLGSLVALGSSCAVISETQCRFADFGNIGYADASLGKPREYFNKYHEKCLAYDIDVQEEIVIYDMGRERGLINFCSKTRYSNQCDRGGQSQQVKSQQHIHSEMLRLQTGIPKITTSISY